MQHCTPSNQQRTQQQPGNRFVTLTHHVYGQVKAGIDCQLTQATLPLPGQPKLPMMAYAAARVSPADTSAVVEPAHSPTASEAAYGVLCETRTCQSSLCAVRTDYIQTSS